MTKLLATTGSKGGTGKSTVAILLTVDLIKKGKKVIICDCDVECPNDYLLLSQKLKKPVKKICAEFPKLIKKKCTKCGLCSNACQNNAIFQAPNKYPIFIKDLCSSCGTCWNVCPFGAIKTKKEKIGEIYLNKISNFWLITDWNSKARIGRNRTSSGPS
jgi:MinD superfamily P-loop ATPase